MLTLAARSLALAHSHRWTGAAVTPPGRSTGGVDGAVVERRPSTRRARPPPGRGPGAGHRQRRADPAAVHAQPPPAPVGAQPARTLGHARHPGADRLLRDRRGGGDVRHARPGDGAVGVVAGRRGQLQSLRGVQPSSAVGWARCGRPRHGAARQPRVDPSLRRSGAPAHRPRHARPVRAGLRHAPRAGRGRGSPSATSPCSRRSS